MVNLKFMKAISFVLSILFITTSFAQQKNVEISLNNDLNVFETSYSSFEKLDANLDINNFQFQAVQVKNKDFFQLRVNGYSKTNIVGKPELPVITRLIQIPEDATLEIENINFEERIIKASEYINDLKLLPVQTPVFKSEDPNKYPFVKDETVYNTDDFYGEKLIRVEIIGHLRNYRIAKISISPFQYNPAQNLLKVAENVEFNIRFINANIEKTIQLQEKYNSMYYKNIAEKLQTNSLLKSGDAITTLPIKYVIVADPMFEETLQPFIEWKKQKGYIVEEAYMDDPNVGTTTSSIRSYLKSLYDNATAENPAPTFGLLVGDVDQIPAFDGDAGYHITDLYYFEYTDDNLPDVYYGRFSANTIAELQPQIDKTLEYEKYELQDPTYLGNSLLIAGVDASYAPTYGNGQINYGSTYYFNEDHNINAHVYLYPESENSRTAIIENINQGVTFANYTAHCDANGWADPSFLKNDVTNLTENYKYGMFIGNCCQSGMFGVAACFGEKILRAENKGAIGYIGASNLSLWDEDYYFGVGVGPIKSNPTYQETSLGAYDRLFHDNGEERNDWFTTNGQMLMAGNLAVTESNTSNVLYYWEMYHLFGDPSVTTYLGIPGELTLDYMESIPMGIEFLEIDTEPYTYVALTKDNELISVAEADETGLAKIDITPITEPGTYAIFASKQNFVPYINEVNIVTSDSPFLVLKNFTIKNTDGVTKESVDLGEEISIDLELKNVGSINAENISLKLRSSDTNVEILDSINSLSSIIANETVLSENSFRIAVNDDVQDQHMVTFHLIMNDAENEWKSDFKIVLNAPHIVVGDFFVRDVIVGNKNLTFDPGELSSINFNISNIGHYKLSPSEISIRTTNEILTVFNESFEVEELEIGTNKNLNANIAVSPDCEIGDIVSLDFNISAGPYSIDTTIAFKVGEQVESFETGDYSAFGWEENTYHEWIVTEYTTDSPDTVFPFNGNYFAQSAYISSNSKSELSITLDILIDDSISFYKKVSCENGNGNRYDYLEFIIDGNSMDYWDGENDWSYHSYPVEQGEHTFVWRYYKDATVTEGFDLAWVDRITLPIHENSVISENNAPYIEADPELIAYQNQAYNCTLTALDSDSIDTPEIEIFEAPEFLTLSKSGHSYLLNGTPSTEYYGNYQVILSVSDGKSFNYFNYDLDVKWPLAIKENIDNSGLEIFPNPAKNILAVTTNDEFLDNSILILNSLGQVIFQDKIQHNISQIDVSDFQQGVYFVKLDNKDNFIIKRLLIIK